VNSLCPRLVTDDRVPCLVVTARVQIPCDLAELKELFDGELHRISNVYNCAAYGLDSSCEDVVALTARTELSFIYFIRNPIKIDHPVRLDSFQEKITRNKEKVDSILAKINIVPITIERFWVEQTGRTPN
jgi:hypothetical protein